MKLPAASCGVSQAELRRSQTRLRSKSYGAVRLAIHPCSPDSGIYAALRQATGYSGEGV